MSTKFQQIKVYNLTKKYNKDYVFKDLNTTITNEKINLLIGYNGKGKSTFLKIILNLISYEGIIEKTFKSVAYCPDKIKLPDFIKVKEFIELIKLNIEKANYLIDEFKIDINKRIDQLSKGMKQKLILIQCLSKDAEAYFFDEPLNGLDDEAIKIFKGEVLSLHKKNKMIIIVTHLIKTFSDLPFTVIDLESDK